MAGGFAVIKDVPKTLVYELSEYINEKSGHDVMPTSILHRPPTAELRPDQKDEDSLLPYPILDPIVRAYIEYYISEFDRFKAWAKNEGIKEIVESPGEYDRMIRLIDANEFKRRQAAPGIKVSRRAFGTGRRVPIVKSHWREWQ